MRRILQKLKTYYSYMKNRKNKRFPKDEISGGFTFVETLAVLVVMSLLASQTGIAAFRLVKKARIATAKTQIETMKLALQSYYVDCGTFPTQEQGLKALWEKPELYPVPENWGGPYTEKKIPSDPWGTDYAYFRKGNVSAENIWAGEIPEGLPFGIVSYGDDKIPGGEDDIFSWSE